MQLQTAERKKAKIKIGLQGSSGSGKSLSALLLAHGLCNSWNRVCVVDSENKSSHLYSHLGAYNVIDISAPFSPEKFIEALNMAVKAGMEVVILDSISAEWDGAGGIIDIHSGMAGNSFTNWSKITPRHNAFINAILQSPVHVLATIRSKQDYVLVEKNGKQVPEKVGLKGIQRDNLDYELTIVFNLDIKHNATINKDRTGLFSGKPEFIITSDTGRQISEWCNQGAESKDALNSNYSSGLEAISRRIDECVSLSQLVSLYNSQPEDIKRQLGTSFTIKKQQLIAIQTNQSKQLSNTFKISTNGTHT